MNEIVSDNEAYVDQKRRRVKRLSSVSSGYKRGKTHCEHCNWKPPVASILNAHHVVPLSCGGQDVHANLILLCPNCHAVAHWVTKRSHLTRRYTGPTTKAALQAWMRHDMEGARKLWRDKVLSDVAPILAAMRQ